VEAYSKEFRRDVLRACDAGEGTQAVALRFLVSESWVRRIKQERREQGKTAPCTTRKRKKKWEPYQDRIIALVEQSPDATLRELQQKLGEDISIYSLCRALKQLGLTLKKSPECCRAGPPRCGFKASELEGLANGPRSGTSCLPR